jgi:hypothetical protein
VSVRFFTSNAVLLLLQAALVALPGAGIPRQLERLRGPGWSLVLPLSIAVVVGAIAAVPEVANWLSWLALVAIPPLAAAALGWAMRGARPGVPLLWLEAGIVAMAIVDSILVFGNQLQAPNAILNAAVPAPGLPQLQYLQMPYSSLGYGDVFVAGVLGGVLAARGERQWPVAVLVLGLSIAWDTLFWYFDTIPATVPVAAALVFHRLARLRLSRAYATSS